MPRVRRPPDRLQPGNVRTDPLSRSRQRAARSRANRRRRSAAPSIRSLPAARLSANASSRFASNASERRAAAVHRRRRQPVLSAQRQRKIPRDCTLMDDPRAPTCSAVIALSSGQGSRIPAPCVVHRLMPFTRHCVQCRGCSLSDSGRQPLLLKMAGSPLNWRRQSRSSMVMAQ